MASESEGPMQIFISYFWDESQKEIVRGIAKKLKENFKVWIDVENLVGQSEEEMVKVGFIFMFFFHLVFLNVFDYYREFDRPKL